MRTKAGLLIAADDTEPVEEEDAAGRETNRKEVLAFKFVDYEHI